MDLLEAMDLASKWLSLDIKHLKTQGLSEKRIWKMCLRDKMPFVYVDRKGKIQLNQSGKKFENENEVKAIIEILLKEDAIYKPSIFLLTRSVKELVKAGAGDVRVSAIEGRVPEEEEKG